jgi:hypothetical protein
MAKKAKEKVKRLVTPAAYSRHRAVSRQAVSKALIDGRIAYAPGTNLIDVEQADRDWANHSEPRPQFPAPRVPSAYQARQAEPVGPANVLQALHDAYRIVTAEYEDVCSRLTGRTESMTVRDLDTMMDAMSERLDSPMARCIHLAFTGEVED